MKRLQEKLHSQRGASILMGLLMLLVCMMVAASVLAASASNAGKYRSNQAEQQKYLVLSSAIRLVADEIQKAEYAGQYEVYEWDVTTTTVIGKDDNGNDITTSHTDYYYHVKQVAGDYSCGVKRSDAAKGELTDQLPLGEELDEIFSKQFTGSGYTPLNSASVVTAKPHTLIVTLTGLPEDTGPDAYKVFKKNETDTAAEAKVTVRVELDHATHHIALTAWLGGGTAPPEGNSDTMIAEMVAKIQETDKDGDPVRVNGNPLVTVSPPAGREPNSLPDGSGSPGKTPTLCWELHWIRKGAAE